MNWCVGCTMQCVAALQNMLATPYGMLALPDSHGNFRGLEGPSGGGGYSAINETKLHKRVNVSDWLMWGLIE